MESKVPTALAGKGAKVKLPLEVAVVVALRGLPGVVTATMMVAPGFAPQPLTVKDVLFSAPVAGYT
jgi:hypothetical protein